MGWLLESLWSPPAVSVVFGVKSPLPGKGTMIVSSRLVGGVVRKVWGAFLSFEFFYLVICKQYLRSNWCAKQVIFHLCLAHNLEKRKMRHLLHLRRWSTIFCWNTGVLYNRHTGSSFTTGMPLSPCWHGNFPPSTLLLSPAKSFCRTNNGKGCYSLLWRYEIGKARGGVNEVNIVFLLLP